MNYSQAAPFYEEPNVSQDTINCISITTNNTLFCTTAWDGSVACYGVSSDGSSIRSDFKTSINVGVPATNCCWTPDNSQIIIGAADGKVYLWNVTSGSTQPQQISQHNNAIIRTTFNPSANCLVEASIDGDIRVMDIRSMSQCMSTCCQPCITAACSSVTNTNIGVSNGHQTFQFNLQNFTQPFDTIQEQEKDTVVSLCYTPSRYFAAGMTNGIVRVKFLDRNESRDGRDLRFRVGRSEGYPQYACSGVESYNPAEHLLTIAEDESVILWSIRERNKVSVYERGVHFNPYAITACAYSQDGSFLVYAKGYNWSFGYPGKVESKYKFQMDNKLIVRLHAIKK